MVRPGLELRSLNFKATVYHAFSSVGSESKSEWESGGNRLKFCASEEGGSSLAGQGVEEE